MVELARVAWDKDNPTFRQVFTARFIPGGTHEQVEWFNALCRKTTTGAIVGDLLEARAAVDITALLGQVRTPTLVLHARDDEVIPIEEGRRLAGGIAGAEFVELESRNHVLLEHEPAWRRFQEAVLEFLHIDAPAASTFAALSARERGAGADGRRAEQRGHRGAPADQREDGPQSRDQHLRQAGRLVARAGHRLRAGARVRGLIRRGP